MFDGGTGQLLRMRAAVNVIGGGHGGGVAARPTAPRTNQTN